MFLISKLSTYIFLGPMLFLLLLGWALYELRRKEYSKVKVLLSVIGILFYLLSTKIGANAIVRPLEDRYPARPLSSIHGNYIVILGGGVLTNVPDRNGSAVLSDASLWRVYAGYRLYRVLPRKIIVCGGTPLRNGFPEATVMADTLRDFGVSRRDIIVETESRNTFENVCNIQKYLKQASSEIALITSAMHMPRSVKVFKKYGITVVPVPCDYRADRDIYRWYDLFPQFHYLTCSFSGLKEYIGILYYKLYYRV
jgi:uncharacterized SAM-binding protein YcdF (DUF218 family)